MSQASSNNFDDAMSKAAQLEGEIVAHITRKERAKDALKEWDQ